MRLCDLEGCTNKHQAKGFCSTHYNKLVHGEHRRHSKVAVPCTVCRTTVLRRSDTLNQRNPTCSVSCRRIVQFGPLLAPSNGYDWSREAIRRAAQAGAAIVDDFSREEIFERDNWTCQVCDIRCSSPDPYSLTAATVDHRIALASGGDHSRANAQTACLSCNSRKQDTSPLAGDPQLAS